MIKLICDRCGKEFNYSPMTRAKFPYLNIYVCYFPPEYSRQIDLCDDCKKKVYDFIFGEKPEE